MLPWCNTTIVFQDTHNRDPELIRDYYMSFFQGRHSLTRIDFDPNMDKLVHTCKVRWGEITYPFSNLNV